MILEYKNYKTYDKKLRQLDNWVNFKEYCRYYWLINYKNKVVVDYGADIKARSYKRLSNLLKSNGGFVYGEIFNKKGLAEEIWIKKQFGIK